MPEREERIHRAAREIEQYLMAHPRAADSLEGIAIWWIGRQRIHEELAIVRAALAELVQAGIIDPSPGQGRDGPFYRLKIDRQR